MLRYKVKPGEQKAAHTRIILNINFNLICMARFIHVELEIPKKVTRNHENKSIKKKKKIKMNTYVSCQQHFYKVCLPTEALVQLVTWKRNTVGTVHNLKIVNIILSKLSYYAIDKK